MRVHGVCALPPAFVRPPFPPLVASRLNKCLVPAAAAAAAARVSTISESAGQLGPKTISETESSGEGGGEDHICVYYSNKSPSIETASKAECAIISKNGLSTIDYRLSTIGYRRLTPLYSALLCSDIMSCSLGVGHWRPRNLKRGHHHLHKTPFPSTCPIFVPCLSW